jgi:uncharacterized protein YkwD
MKLSHRHDIALIPYARRNLKLFLVAIMACLAIQSGQSAPLTLESWQAESGKRLIKIRADAGQPPVCWDTRLYEAARGHADYLAANQDVFEHTEQSGRPSFYGTTIGDRTKKAGYNGAVFISENILKGCDNDVACAMNSWVGSAGHRANMESNEIDRFAVARTGNAWVMVFGKQSEPDATCYSIPA